MCRSILDENPHVDEVWEIPLTSIAEVAEVWPRFEREALERKNRGDFDEVFFTQIAPSNLHNYIGTIRSSILRAYPHPITVPVSPVVRLRADEIENVRLFAETHHLSDKTHVILFECSPKSGQSLVNPDFAIKVAQALIEKIPDVCVILSSNETVCTGNDRIVDASVLTLRENAELTKYCTLFIGCSSGISWLCTSDWAKPLPMIQLIKTDTIWFASVACDHEQIGLSTASIIEMSDYPADKVCQCVVTVLQDGFSTARRQFHEEIKLSFDYFKAIQDHLLDQNKFENALSFLYHNTKKHRFRPEFYLPQLKKIIKKWWKYTFRFKK